jgi:hypothetical protein
MPSVPVSHLSQKWDRLVGHFIVVYNKVNPACPAVPRVPRKNKTFACGKTLNAATSWLTPPDICPNLSKALGRSVPVLTRAARPIFDRLSKSEDGSRRDGARHERTSVTHNLSFVVLLVKRFCFRLQPAAYCGEPAELLRNFSSDRRSIHNRRLNYEDEFSGGNTDRG